MNTRRIIRFSLWGLPWLILISMVVTAYLPILRGNKYLLPVHPVDPREFFRGNYVRLSYAFTTLPRKGLIVVLDANKKYQFGDILYLSFTKTDQTLQPAALSTARLAQYEVFMRVQPEWQLTSKDTQFNLVSGLESFFAPNAEAKAWEDALRSGKILAQVAIDSSGNARLIKLVRE